jgi:hypothetical protein
VPQTSRGFRRQLHRPRSFRAQPVDQRRHIHAGEAIESLLFQKKLFGEDLRGGFSFRKARRVRNDHTFLEKRRSRLPLPKNGGNAVRGQARNSGSFSECASMVAAGGIFYK